MVFARACMAAPRLARPHVPRQGEAPIEPFAGTPPRGAGNTLIAAAASSGYTIPVLTNSVGKLVHREAKSRISTPER